MGLKDLIPDDVDESTSGVPQNSNQKQDDQEIVKTFGKPPHRKEFTQKQWDKVQRVVHNEFGMSIGEVISSPEEERYELLHEAIMFNEGSGDNSPNVSTVRCAYCGDACDGTHVVLEGKKFCVHHTVAQAETELNHD